MFWHPVVSRPFPFGRGLVRFRVGSSRLFRFTVQRANHGVHNGRSDDHDLTNDYDNDNDGAA